MTKRADSVTTTLRLAGQLREAEFFHYQQARAVGRLAKRWTGTN
jgi:hypothetical protein